MMRILSQGLPSATYTSTGGEGEGCHLICAVCLSFVVVVFMCLCLLGCLHVR